MPNKYIVTITDLHGSRQYSVHKIVKKVLLFSALFLLLVAVMTFVYIRYMHGKIETFKSEQHVLHQTIEKLKKESDTYKKQNSKLLEKIAENNEKLASLKQYLNEVEQIIGLGPDVDTDLQTRVEKAKEHKEAEIEQIREEATKQAKAEKIDAIQKALLLNSIPNGKPLQYRRISSTFGYRIHPVTHQRSFHAGLDLPADYGTPIYAPASGVVMYAGRKGPYGNFLLLSHSYGFKTAYGHLSRYVVHSGDFVNKGDLIAYVGSTGRSTGAHLHYEVRYLTKWLDPMPFMFWDTVHLQQITEEVPLVHWESIFEQTKKLIRMATRQEK